VQKKEEGLMESESEESGRAGGAEALLPVEARAKVIRAAAARIGVAREQQQKAKVEAICRASKELRVHLDAWDAELRSALETEVKKRSDAGWPPSYVRVAGLGHLERPLNQLLAWWVDPEADHGLARGFLAMLARRAGAHALAEDVALGLPVEVYAESAVDEGGKEPDLLARTEHGALMLENKLGAGESGNQYGPYLSLFHRWASNVPEGERRALLCCPKPRPKPEGWSDVLLHREVASLLREIAEQPGATPWGRVSALVVAEAFEDRRIGALMARVRAALRETAGPRAATIREMRELLDTLGARPVVLPGKEGGCER
jgi:hypothetical protein